jgi:hypothetical protein
VATKDGKLKPKNEEPCKNEASIIDEPVTVTKLTTDKEISSKPSEKSVIDQSGK